MVFSYPVAFKGKHAPWGYTRYASYKDWLRDDFLFRCVYCLEREKWYPNRASAFGVDHIKPKGVGRYKKLRNVYENLAYACNRCNSRKGTLTLIDPRQNPFGKHLKVEPDGTIAGLTPDGTALILALGLDEPEIVATRLYYIQIYEAFQNPQMKQLPIVQNTYFFAFSYPENLPDLTAKSPKGNHKPQGARQCCYQKNRGNPKKKVYF